MLGNVLISSKAVIKMLRLHSTTHKLFRLQKNQFQIYLEHFKPISVCSSEMRCHKKISLGSMKRNISSEIKYLDVKVFSD